MDGSTPSFGRLAGAAAVLTVVYSLAVILYNLYLHPLARFPGPLLWRATRLTYLRNAVAGTLPRDILRLHRRYGPVVRIAPNELSFGTPEAWRDIYGRKGEADELPKYDLFYTVRGAPRSIISETHHNHAGLRRQLLPQFSDRKMREQEPIIAGYIDLLMARLREHVVDPDRRDPVTGGAARRALNMVDWYTWTTFDIIGDLAFGEPFGCLNRAREDPWVTLITRSFEWAPIINAIKYLGLERVLVPLLGANRFRKEHQKRTAEKLERRMALQVERPDLIEGLLNKKDELNLDKRRLLVNASTLIVAGSETTATLLSGVTYLLLRNPDALKKVTEEVRTAFSSEDEITLTSVGQLNYMLACLNEALRCYPPVAGGLPRYIPKGRGGVTIAGQTVPEKTIVSLWQWAAYHNEDNFREPFSYRPERFLHDPKFAGDRLDVLQPFSVGPRNCLGQNLSFAEMRLILARILYNFDLELADKTVDWLDQRAQVLWRKKPLPVYLTPVR
ncbi:cytochrome P450 [Echria macrotheca]|uniref:Cytochrome P450 n=1 Tax=Echria macrotheca TaxID=438768 RepID=A0AAJ0BQM6_9PEZI|nr:cytochrome P450 [Echria macrotheca]